MPITTLDQALAGMQYPRIFCKLATASSTAGTPNSYWGIGGFPGAGGFDTTLNGVVLSSTSAQVTGQIPFTNPTAGNNSYLARLVASAASTGTFMLVDRLWHNGGFTITSTAAQAITSPTWPSRDANGGTSGVGVLIACEVSAATGVGTPVLTLSYTNSDGVSGRTATNIDATIASAGVGRFYRFGLQAGDVGVRSVQSLTLSATWTSGTINLVAYRVLAQVEITAANTSNSIDALTGGFPRLFDGSVPFPLFVTSATTVAALSGSVIWSQG